MLDPKFIRANPDAVREAVKNKLEKVDIDEFLELDRERRDLLQEADALKQERNTGIGTLVGRVRFQFDPAGYSFKKCCLPKSRSYCNK